MRRSLAPVFRKWLYACAALVMLSLVWALNSPVGSSPDESAHITYAWGTVTGQTFPWSAEEFDGDNGAKQVAITYPQALDERPSESCYAFAPEKVPCGKDVEDVNGLTPDSSGYVTGSSYMARYPHAYYLLVGLVEYIGIRAGLSGLVTLTLARIVSALTSGIFLIVSGYLLIRRFAPTVVIGMLLLLLTPQAMSLFGAINPNGLEICSAVLVAACVVCLRDDAAVRGRLSPGLVWLSVSATMVLVFTRPASVVWACLLVALVVVRVPGSDKRPIMLLSAPAKLAGTAAIAGGIAWFVYQNLSRGGGAADQDLSAWTLRSPLLRLLLVILRFGNMMVEGYGLLGWLDIQLPVLMFVLWFGGVIVFARSNDGKTDSSSTSILWPILYLFLASSVIVVQSYRSAFGWQGRYALPVLFAFLVLMIPSISSTETERNKDSQGPLRLGIPLLSLSLTCFASVVVLFRYQYGYSSTYVRFASLPVPDESVYWSPVILGSSILLLLSVLGTVAAIALQVASLRDMRRGSLSRASV